MKLSCLFRFALVLMVLALFASDSFARCRPFSRHRERHGFSGYASGNFSNTTKSAGCGIGGCPVGR